MMMIAEVERFIMDGFAIDGFVMDGFVIDGSKNVMLQSEVCDMTADPVVQAMLKKVDPMMELKGPKILVVDDEPANVELLEAHLSMADYEVVTAYGGEEALEKVESEKPDLILLDVMMPGLNGFEISKILKGNVETMFIPVVMVTALSKLKDKIKAIESGADDFLTKPVNSLELITRVKSLLRIKYLHDELIERKLCQIRAEKELFQRELKNSQDSLDAKEVRDYIALLNEHSNDGHQVAVRDICDKSMTRFVETLNRASVEG
jgi:DNA-binding response OmpR family regulator